MTDKQYMEAAELMKLFSNEKQHKVGACIVKDGKVIGKGTNTLLDPKNSPTSRDRTLPIKMQKYSYICHAEMDAIIKAEQSLKGATLYTTLFPCNECAKMIIAAGIKEVFYRENYSVPEIVEMSKILFDTCGVKYKQI